MIGQVPKQTLVHLLSDSFKTYRGNFVKLFPIFLIFFALLVLPIIISLDTYTAQLHATVQGLETIPSFTFFYIFVPLLNNGMLTMSTAAILVVSIFTSPLCMGMAGKIIAEAVRGRQCSIREALIWTCKNYLKLLLVYSLSYVILAAFAVAGLALLYWMIRDVSHVVQETWMYPTIAAFAVGGAALILGTLYSPFGMIEDRKSPLRSFTNSFRVMYSKSFIHNFPHLLVAAVIACAFAFAALLPVTYEFLFAHPSNVQGYFLQFFKTYESDMLFIWVSVVAFSFAGVFLYIFAYNTYRKANLVLYRKENNKKTYRRKIIVVQPPERRRVG